MLGYLTLRPQETRSPLDAALAAFLLDRESMRCTPNTIEHHLHRRRFHRVPGYLKSRTCPRSAPRIFAPIWCRYRGAGSRTPPSTRTRAASKRGLTGWCREATSKLPMDRVAMPRLDKRVPAPFSPDDLGRARSLRPQDAPWGSRCCHCADLLGQRAAGQQVLRAQDVLPGHAGGISHGARQGPQIAHRASGGQGRGAIARMLGNRGQLANVIRCG
jgi:hypothetical protein